MDLDYELESIFEQIREYTTSRKGLYVSEKSMLRLAASVVFGLDSPTLVI
jgi:hypothetical protein